MHVSFPAIIIQHHLHEHKYFWLRCRWWQELELQLHQWVNWYRIYQSIFRVVVEVLPPADSRTWGSLLPSHRSPVRCTPSSLFPRTNHVADTFCSAQFNQEQGCMCIPDTHARRTYIHRTHLHKLLHMVLPFNISIWHLQIHIKLEYRQASPIPPQQLSRLKLIRENTCSHSVDLQAPPHSQIPQTSVWALCLSNSPDSGFSHPLST